jgi:hypothetical protein
MDEFKQQEQSFFYVLCVRRHGHILSKIKPMRLVESPAATICPQNQLRSHNMAGGAAHQPK